MSYPKPLPPVAKPETISPSELDPYENFADEIDVMAEGIYIDRCAMQATADPADCFKLAEMFYQYREWNDRKHEFYES